MVMILLQKTLFSRTNDFSFLFPCKDLELMKLYTAPNMQIEVTYEQFVLKLLKPLNFFICTKIFQYLRKSHGKFFLFPVSHEAPVILIYLAF